jgi:hypothetical protein
VNHHARVAVFEELALQTDPALMPVIHSQIEAAADMLYHDGGAMNDNIHGKVSGERRSTEVTSLPSLLDIIMDAVDPCKEGILPPYLADAVARILGFTLPWKWSLNDTDFTLHEFRNMLSPICDELEGNISPKQGLKSLFSYSDSVLCIFGKGSRLRVRAMRLGSIYVCCLRLFLTHTEASLLSLIEFRERRPRFNVIEDVELIELGRPDLTSTSFAATKMIFLKRLEKVTEAMKHLLSLSPTKLEPSLEFLWHRFRATFLPCIKISSRSEIKTERHSDGYVNTRTGISAEAERMDDGPGQANSPSPAEIHKIQFVIEQDELSQIMPSENTIINDSLIATHEQHFLPRDDTMGAPSVKTTSSPTLFSLRLTEAHAKAAAIARQRVASRIGRAYLRRLANQLWAEHHSGKQAILRGKGWDTRERHIQSLSTLNYSQMKESLRRFDACLLFNLYVPDVTEPPGWEKIDAPLAARAFDLSLERSNDSFVSFIEALGAFSTRLRETKGEIIDFDTFYAWLKQPILANGCVEDKEANNYVHPHHFHSTLLATLNIIKYMLSLAKGTIFLPHAYTKILIALRMKERLKLQMQTNLINRALFLENPARLNKLVSELKNIAHAVDDLKSSKSRHEKLAKVAGSGELEVKESNIYYEQSKAVEEFSSGNNRKQEVSMKVSFSCLFFSDTLQYPSSFSFFYLPQSTHERLKVSTNALKDTNSKYIDAQQHLAAAQVTLTKVRGDAMVAQDDIKSDAINTEEVLTEAAMRIQAFKEDEVETIRKTDEMIHFGTIQMTSMVTADRRGEERLLYYLAENDAERRCWWNFLRSRGRYSLSTERAFMIQAFRLIDTYGFLLSPDAKLRFSVLSRSAFTLKRIQAAAKKLFYRVISSCDDFPFKVSDINQHFDYGESRERDNPERQHWRSILSILVSSFDTDCSGNFDEGEMKVLLRCIFASLSERKLLLHFPELKNGTVELESVLDYLSPRVFWRIGLLGLSFLRNSHVTGLEISRNKQGAYRFGPTFSSLGKTLSVVTIGASMISSMLLVSAQRQASRKLAGESIKLLRGKEEQEFEEIENDRKLHSSIIRVQLLVERQVAIFIKTSQGKAEVAMHLALIKQWWLDLNKASSPNRSACISTRDLRKSKPERRRLQSLKSSYTKESLFTFAFRLHCDQNGMLITEIPHLVRFCTEYLFLQPRTEEGAFGIASSLCSSVKRDEDIILMTLDRIIGMLSRMFCPPPDKLSRLWNLRIRMGCGLHLRALARLHLASCARQQAVQITLNRKDVHAGTLMKRQKNYFHLTRQRLYCPSIHFSGETNYRCAVLGLHRVLHYNFNREWTSARGLRNNIFRALLPWRWLSFFWGSGESKVNWEAPPREATLLLLLSKGLLLSDVLESSGS